MKITDIDTINFIDQAENRNACAIVRLSKKGTLICFSLEDDGDVEVMLSTEDAKKLHEAIGKTLSI